MPTMKMAARLAALASVVLWSLAACSGGGDPSPTPTPAPAAFGTVTGVVADIASGEPLAGVEVKIGDKTATSDAGGTYAIADLPPNAATVARFSKPQYASNFATVEVVKDRISVANRSMAKVAVKQEVDATAGATVTLPGSPAQVQLPPAGLVDAATGAAYSGRATVEMTPIDASRNPRIMPGNYRAEGEPAPIESMGALQVELRDSSGALLNLAPGKSATIRIPVPATSASPPLSIPLYYFKETSGLWVREGTATLVGDPPQQYYEGTVTHFTVWNADQPLDTIVIHGCVVDKDNHPLEANVSSLGLDYNGIAFVQTRSGGLFDVPARRDSRVQVMAESGAFSASVDVTTGTTDLTLPACLVIDKKPPVILMQPASVNVAPGAFTSVQVVASNAKQYKWYRNGTLVASGSRVLGLIGGADVAGDYYVVVSNEQGDVTSSTVHVTIGQPALPPNLLTQPLGASVVAGSPATFLVLAQGESLSYQWLRNGVAIVGARGPSLTLGSTAAADDGAQFSCRVSNNAGTVVSNAARLTVTGVAVAPGFITHPSNLSIGIGERATFSATTSGTLPLAFQWLRNGDPIAGATGPTYQTPAAALADSGSQFSVRVTNQQGTVTSNSATLTVSAAPTVPGLYLSFAQGTGLDGQFGMAAIPAAGGTPASFLAAGQGTLSDLLIQGQVSGGAIRNVYQRGYFYWKNQQLYRRDLVGTAGLPAEVRVSSASAVGVCNLISGTGPDFVGLGSDFNDANRSWKILQKAGLDGTCSTADDQFLAVRADMGAASAPLDVPRPVATVHGSDGTLTGWIVRNGQQVQRTGPDFQNPVALFALTAADLQFDQEGSAANMALFTSGGKLYAADLAAAAPLTPTVVTTLADGEALAGSAGAVGGDIIAVIGGTASTRVLRYAPADKSTVTLGSVSGSSTLVAVTPTRVVLRGTPGALVSLPLTGGAARDIYIPSAPRFAFLHYRGGERIWQDMQSYLMSVNSDASDVRVLQDAKMAGCILKLQSLLDGGATECDAILVVEGNVVRSYDAQTGAVRVNYGTITPAAAPLLNYYSFSMLTAWGQGGVLSQIVSDPNNPKQQSVVNYYLKTAEPGITSIVMP